MELPCQKEKVARNPVEYDFVYEKGSLHVGSSRGGTGGEKLQNKANKPHMATTMDHHILVCGDNASKSITSINVANVKDQDQSMTEQTS